MKTAIICPIFKKGNPTKTENYRGISLLDTCYKILTTLILERLNLQGSTKMDGPGAY